MAYYSLRINMNSGLNQAQIMDQIKGQGDDVIQTSDGLCIQTKSSLDELKAFLKEKNLDQVLLTKINRDSQSEVAELSPDVRAFINCPI